MCASLRPGEGGIRGGVGVGGGEISRVTPNPSATKALSSKTINVIFFRFKFFSSFFGSNPPLFFPPPHVAAVLILRLEIKTLDFPDEWIQSQKCGLNHEKKQGNFFRDFLYSCTMN